jgi:hypothetical protein
VLFEKPQAFTAEHLLLATELSQFVFQIFLRASQVFKLKAVAALQIVLFGEQSLTLLLNLFPQTLLFVFDLLTEQFSLLLQIVCLLLDLQKLMFVRLLELLLLAIQHNDFCRQFFTCPFGQALLFELQVFIELTNSIGVILTFAFGLSPQSITFRLQNRALLTELHAIFVELRSH